MGENLEVVRLSPREIDDQVIAEVRALAPYLHPERQTISAEQLLERLASRQAVVARRECGMVPEIVGMAIQAPAGKPQDCEWILALDPDLGGSRAEDCLRRALEAEQASFYLFRPGGRAPMGLGVSPG
jgi:hypothetical protein